MTSLDFNPDRTATPPKDAASVIVLRDGERGVEVFCVHRHARSAFLGGAVVFPGGKLDAADASDDWVALTTPMHARTLAFAAPYFEGPNPAEASPATPEQIASSMSSAPPDDPRHPLRIARSIAIAGCRETLEEGCILPTEPAPLSHEQLIALRNDCHAAHTTLTKALSALGRHLDLGQLVPWARWVTPKAESRRYDARFFLLRLPKGQIGRHDEHETTQSFWATPQDVLDKFMQGHIFVAPPTTRSLELLTKAGDVAHAMALAEQQSLAPICPQFVPGDEATGPYLALPGDPAHDVKEKRVEGSTRFVLRDGLFVSGPLTP